MPILDPIYSKERWFISGPMTGYPQFNRPAFFKAEQVLKYRGFVYNPARLGWDDGEPKDYMLVAIPMLLTCTHLYVLKGAENSSGATIERLLAIYCHLDITWEG